VRAPALALVLAAGALPVGCATAPREGSPVATLPPLPPDGFVASGEERGLEVEATSWWADLGGSELDALVAEALLHNLDLEAAAARVDAAAAQARVAGAPLRPEVAASLGAARGRNVFVGLPIPGGEGVLSSTSTSVGVSLGLAWEIDLWSRLKAGKRAALEDLLAAESELSGARQSLAAQVAKAWVALRETDAQVALASRTVESYALSAQRLRARYERGIAPALDLRLALSNLATARSLLAAAQERRERVARQLEILLGRYPAGALATEATVPEVPPAVPAGLPAELLGRRPDLLASASRVRAAGLRLKQAKRRRWPSLTLTASGGAASDDLSDLVDLDFRVWDLAANLLAPILQGGRIRAGIDLAAAREVEAVADHGARVLAALAEVETALAAERALARREAAVREDVEQAVAARELAEEQYRRGLVEIVTVLESRRRALSAQSLALSVRRARLDARIDLHLALGGGFHEGAEAPAGSPGAESRS
jgi:NodT family efflux transporter outer membrane factor (OMF) lipoprotein